MGSVERLGYFRLAAKLSAGGVDVSAAGFADVRVHTALAKDFLEGDDVARQRPLKWQAGDFVVTVLTADQLEDYFDREQPELTSKEITHIGSHLKRSARS